MSARMEEVLPAVASARARTPGRESPGQLGSRVVNTRSASRARCPASAASAGSSKTRPLATSCRPVSGLITALPTSLRHWRWRKSSGQCSFGQCPASAPNQAGGPPAALSPIQASFSATTRWASPSRFTAEALTTSIMRAPAGSNPSRLPRPFCSRSTVASAASGNPLNAAAENGALQATTSRRMGARPARTMGWQSRCSITASPSGSIRVRSSRGVSSRRRAMTVKPARCR